MINVLWLKFKTHQAAKFVFVGVLNTIVGYGAFGLFILIEFHYTLALTLATIIGVIHSYCWNKYFTFKSPDKSLKEFVRFISVYAFTYVFNILMLWIFIDKGHMHPLIAQAVVLLVVTMISFTGHKFWSFKGH